MTGFGLTGRPIAGTGLRFFARRRDNPSFALRLTRDLSGFRIARKGGGEWDGGKCCKALRARWDVHGELW
jgi:hypothetical protein